jgi:O-antigen/teichoic acid export membrane protein
MTEPKSSFFRQSAWMVVATVAGGGAMMLVHTLVAKLGGDAAYAEFKALLSSFYVIAAVGGGLWTLFAQQRAAAVTDLDARRVAGAARRVGWVILVVWLAVAGGLALAQPALMRTWKLSSPLSLWATWLVGLLTLWISVLRGLVQGRQNFLALGWIAILDGFGRFGSVFVVLTVLANGAAGAMMGAAIGCVGALAIGLWGAQDTLRLEPAPVPWRTWIGGLVPLALNAAAVQLFLQYDNMFWQALVPADRLAEWNLGARYSPAQTIGFGITQFTVPLALVMLPRIARSAATGQASDTLRLTVLATAGMGCLASLACTLFPKLPLQVMFFNKPESWGASPLVPWFAWGMTLYTLANVYLNDLFARRRFGVVPGVVALGIAYVVTLQLLKPHLLTLAPADAYRMGVQTLGLFNLALLALSAWYSHRRV